MLLILSTETWVQKNDMRRQARLCRDRIAKDARLDFAYKLIENFFGQFSILADTNVAGYWPKGSEFDVKPLLFRLDQEDCNCLLPIVIGKEKILNFGEWQPNDKLARSDIGVFEPTNDKSSGIPSIVLVPLLAFDKQGYRLGYGGGYYDQTLTALRARERDEHITAIGIGYAEQEVCQVPHENFDQRLDWIVTEKQASAFA